jgi:small subunit ribosomal protein S8
MFTDPISDMLTRVRNAAAAKKVVVEMPYSKLKHNLAVLLQREGYVEDVTARDGVIKQLEVKLKYQSGQPAILGIQRVSKPGQRMYAPSDKIPRANGGMGITVISTSKGLMTDKQARKERFGGEIICQVW